jgi:hypothetical protein
MLSHRRICLEFDQINKHFDTEHIERTLGIVSKTHESLTIRFMKKRITDPSIYNFHILTHHGGILKARN